MLACIFEAECNSHDHLMRCELAWCALQREVRIELFADMLNNCKFFHGMEGEVLGDIALCLRSFVCVIVAN